MSRKLTIVIPAYEPDNNLIELIVKLNSFFKGFSIIVVNDGSLNHDDIFNVVKEKENVTLLNHEVNLGKGEALKTAFRYIKSNIPNSIIITADSDGQHKPEDIKRVYDFYIRNSNGGIVLGSRKFDNDVPFKSSFGNNVSKGLLRLCLNHHLNDNQTGLRAFDYKLLDFMINVKGSRFEYEMNMLSEAVRSDIDIKEIAIQTIYINNNKGTHFRPVKDFTKISLCIMKYLWPSIISLIIDFVIFMVLVLVNKNLNITKLICFSLLASTSAVVINLIINLIGIFYGNKKIFKSKNRWVKYIIKSILNIGLSLGILLLFNLGFHNYIVIRIISSLILIIFFATFNYNALKKSKLNEE